MAPKHVDPRLSRIIEKASGTLASDAGELINLIDEIAKEIFWSRELLPPIKYMPVFVGHTRDNEKIVVYKNVDNESELHIRRPDGKLWAMGPGSTVETQFDTARDLLRMMVHSDAWSGEAVGNRHDLVEEPGLRLSY